MLDFAGQRVSFVEVLEFGGRRRFGKDLGSLDRRELVRGLFLIIV